MGLLAANRSFYRQARENIFQQHRLFSKKLDFDETRWTASSSSSSSRPLGGGDSDAPVVRLSKGSVCRACGWVGRDVGGCRSRKLDTERRGREEGEGDFAALRPPAAQSTMVEDDKRRGLPICTSAVACSSSGACQCGCIRVEGPAMLSCVRSCGDQLAGPAGSLTTHEDALPAVYLHVSGSPIPHRLAFALLLAAGA